MKHWLTFPRSSGITSRQAHCDLPAGTFEREFGREGFFGPTTHFYHQRPPTDWLSFEGDLRPRAYDFAKLADGLNSPWEAPVLLHNAHTRVRFWRTSGAMDHLVANGDGDELLFIHSGQGALYCDFGYLRFTEGDYILLPRSTMWRVECEGAVAILMMEATNEGYRLPEKGMVGPHAVFDAAVLDIPEINEAFHAQYTAPIASDGLWRVVAKRRNKQTVITYDHNPLNVVGWHGDNLPVRLNWRDIRPLMSHRYHLPPSAHTTFLTNRFVVCTFVPRPAEMDPGALKVPFYHSNNDFDEFIFYHCGNFFSRDNIHPGMATLHPAGFPHGPHPKAFKLAAEADATRQPNDAPKMLDEVAVMIDTRDALDIAPEAEATEWKDYSESWKAKA